MKRSARTDVGWQTPWASNVPKGWDVKRITYVLRLSQRRNDEHSAKLLSMSASKGVVPKAFEDASQARTGEELKNYFRVLPGQFVVNPMWVMHGGLGASTVTGVTSPDYRVYDPAAGINPRFIHYLLKTREYLELFGLLARGTTTYDRRIAKDDFNQLPVLCPPPQVQIAIADFLDRKTAAIDTLIEKKQKLLELLAEKRAALISEAVTKGLDPNVPMKDSGVPWIGEIPEHWEVRKTRFLCRLTTGTRDTQDIVQDGPYPFFVRSQVVRTIDTYSFEGEGVLTSGDGAGVGKIFHHHIGKLEFHQRVYLYFEFKGVLPRYYYYFLKEHLHRVALAGNAKSTVDSLRRPMLMDFPCSLPPVDEQRKIVGRLDAEAAKLRQQEDGLNRQLLLFAEYRQAIITAAVTGQLDFSADSESAA